jgi:hypothetical protein
MEELSAHLLRIFGLPKMRLSQAHMVCCIHLWYFPHNNNHISRLNTGKEYNYWVNMIAVHRQGSPHLVISILWKKYRCLSVLHMNYQSSNWRKGVAQVTEILCNTKWTNKWIQPLLQENWFCLVTRGAVKYLLFWPKKKNFCTTPNS